MKKTLLVLFVSLLLIGCGNENDKKVYRKKSKPEVSVTESGGHKYDGKYTNMYTMDIYEDGFHYKAIANGNGNFVTTTNVTLDSLKMLVLLKQLED